MSILAILEQRSGQWNRMSFETLAAVLARPYEEQPDLAYLAEAPRAEQRVLQTFCGT